MRRRLLLLGLVLGAFACARARASWTSSSATNLALTTPATGSRHASELIADGAGGAFVKLASSGMEFAPSTLAHVTVNGALDALWPAGGITGSSYGIEHALVADGTGGLFHYRLRRGAPSGWWLGADHHLGSSALDPAWPATGLEWFSADPPNPIGACSDGAGGLLVVWTEGGADGTDQCFVKHLRGSGQEDPAWPAGGRTLWTQPGARQQIELVPDGGGGLSLLWRDAPAGGAPGTYALHVLADGSLDARWPSDGALVGDGQFRDGSAVSTDGDGGLLFCWHDGAPPYAIRARRVLATGAVDPAWPGGGAIVATSALSPTDVATASDGAGGVYVSWSLWTVNTTKEVRAAHLPGSGVPGPGQPVDGTLLSNFGNGSAVVTDGEGGALVAWRQYSATGEAKIRAHRLQPGGTLDPEWPAGFTVVCSAPGNAENVLAVGDGIGGMLASWDDYRAGWDAYMQRVGHHGLLGDPEPAIVSASDFPHDQGGRVLLLWSAAAPDLAFDPHVYAYDVQRARPPASTAAGEQWETVQSVLANHLSPQLGLGVPTFADSLTAFRVIARSADGTWRWPSRRALGSALDNLAPATPAHFGGTYANGGTSLRWDRCPDADFAHFQLHRGTRADFAPDATNLVAETVDTSFVDAAGAPCWYKLRAVDVHGNRSAIASVLPDGTLDTPAGATATVGLARPTPSPAREEALVRFTLPYDTHVRLAIHDAAGRRVRLLAGETLAAGDHALVWNLTDERGRQVGPGVYFVAIEAEGLRRVQRLLVLR